ncbi:MAG: SGNH/GDSL hydrolase family protein [Actinobacteria bacterium]|nr:SGNH/GDSL hydrolase family protein [Actinomycetota bacterium]
MNRPGNVFARGAARAVMIAVLALTAGGCLNYVALGDSYTAGPVIPVQQTDPAGCLRSDHNYPHLVAASLDGAVLHDVSCSGATTGDMTSPQSIPGGTNAPQFDALQANTNAVSLTIGGNDIGFVSIAENCSSAVNAGTPCQDRYVKNGHDTIAESIADTAPKVQAVLQGIHARAPHSTIFLLGYLDIMPDSGVGCWPQMPITDGDAPYVRDKEKQLNAMLQTVAAANDAVYVDTYTPSIGHDACQLPTVRWVEPVVPVNPAAPIHPNEAGMQATANILLAAMHGRGF